MTLTHLGDDLLRAFGKSISQTQTEEAKWAVRCIIHIKAQLNKPQIRRDTTDNISNAISLMKRPESSNEIPPLTATEKNRLMALDYALGVTLGTIKDLVDLIYTRHDVVIWSLDLLKLLQRHTLY